MNKVKPITPAEVDAMPKPIPDEVIGAFNAWIMREWDGYRAKITIDEITNYIINDLAVDEEELKYNKWMDVEDLYRSFGWEVHFVRLPMHDTTPNYFIFSRGKSVGCGDGK